MSTLAYIRKELRVQGTPERAANLARFFKTGEGQYGYGDVFLGVTVPEIRAIVKKYYDLPLVDIVRLLHSPEHEFRLAALLLLVARFKRASSSEQKRIYALYCANTKWINNWDLVDLSAEHIVGAYLRGKSTAPLYRLARSKNLWERRIAIVATFHYIKKREPDETLRIATMLLGDCHDLIHKATGWMLREVGKRCGERTLCNFLDVHRATMPRTMLRYSIERLPEGVRKHYLIRT